MSSRLIVLTLRANKEKWSGSERDLLAELHKENSVLSLHLSHQCCLWQPQPCSILIGESW